jgi:hypothetical protein
MILIGGFFFAGGGEENPKVGGKGNEKVME